MLALRICEWCGEAISPTKKASAKFCSRVCCDRAKNRRSHPIVTTECKCCGREISPTHGRQYCSTKCRTDSVWDRRKAELSLARRIRYNKRTAILELALVKIPELKEVLR
jgi:hypothetical protein